LKSKPEVLIGAARLNLNVENELLKTLRTAVKARETWMPTSDQSSLKPAKQEIDNIIKLFSLENVIRQFSRQN